MVRIIDVEQGSIAEELGIRPGASLISINGKDISDQLDYRFYASAEELELRIEQEGEQIIFEIEKDVQEDLGLILEDLEMRQCGNKCVFCFVHQNPKGLRKSLYFKDEDYRFSFLYGHYVTLSNADERDLHRIVEQRLSPLYISVHATEPKLRQYLLGIRQDDHLMEKIHFLAEHGIELHTQVVLCPGLNDGEHLERTMQELKALFPQVRSVAIVPVGLTRFRRGLPRLNPVTREYSLQLMQEIDGKREQFKREIGSAFVYLADEFYIATDTALPEEDYYEDFYQLENGVGLTRDFISRVKAELPELQRLAPELNLTLVTGVLGARALKRYILPLLKHIPGLKISLLQVVNRFFGESITVAGLLVGQDIYDALRGYPELGDYVILPPRVINQEGLFLDDWTLPRLERKLKKEVFIFPESFVQLVENIRAQRTVKSAELARKIRHSRVSLLPEINE